MGATDVLPNRLEGAKSAAIEALKELPTGGVVSVIAAERTARIVANETSDLGRVRQAINDLRPTSTTGDLGDALELSLKLARRSGDAEILVATDGALATRQPPRSMPRSTSCRSDAIATTRRSPRWRSEPIPRPDPVGVHRRREPRPRLGQAPARGYGDGVLIEAQDLTLDP